MFIVWVMSKEDEALRTAYMTHSLWTLGGRFGGFFGVCASSSLSTGVSSPLSLDVSSSLSIDVPSPLSLDVPSPLSSDESSPPSSDDETKPHENAKMGEWGQQT